MSYENFIAMQESLAQELRSRLSQGAVHFSFYKASGEVCEAYGTTRIETISELAGEDVAENATPKGTGKTHEGQVCYWDIDKQGWRSCKENSIIEVKE